MPGMTIQHWPEHVDIVNTAFMTSKNDESTNRIDEVSVLDGRTAADVNAVLPPASHHGVLHLLQ